MAELIVRTANLGNRAHNVTRRRQQLVLRDLVVGRPTAVALQECVPGLKAPAGYQLHGRGQVRLLVRNGYRDTGAGWLEAHKGKLHHWPDRLAVWATIDLGRAGRASFVSTHLNAHIDEGGRPRPMAPPELAPALDHIAKLAELGEYLATLGPVFVAGDFNVDALADAAREVRVFPSARLGKAGLLDAWAMPPARGHGATLGGRRVDRIFAGGLVKLRALDVRPLTIPGEGVHRAVSTTWRTL